MREDHFYNRSSHTYSIPRALMALDIFTQTEKMILTRIISLSSKYLDKGGCTLSNSALADAHNCSTGTVSNVISKASWLGFIVKREDKLKTHTNPNETTSITQERRIVMVIPEFLEGIGEIWGEGYFAGNKIAREVVKKINSHLIEKIKTKEKEKGAGLMEVEFALVSQLLTQAGIDSWNNYKLNLKNTPSIIPFTPPTDFQVPLLFENPSLFIFTKINIYENKHSEKTLGEVPSEQSPNGSEKLSLMEERRLLTIERNKRLHRRATKVLDHLSKLKKLKIPLKHSDAHLENIKARLRDGYSVGECFKVLETKILDPYFQDNPKFYRPTTLFCPKNFESYLNEDPTQYKKQTSTNKPSNGSGYTGTRRYKEAKVVKNVFTPWED